LKLQALLAIATEAVSRMKDPKYAGKPLVLYMCEWLADNILENVPELQTALNKASSFGLTAPLSSASEKASGGGSGSSGGGGSGGGASKTGKKVEKEGVGSPATGAHAATTPASTPAPTPAPELTPTPAPVPAPALARAPPVAKPAAAPAPTTTKPTRFPPHWGSPPGRQTRDILQLPGGSVGANLHQLACAASLRRWQIPFPSSPTAVSSAFACGLCASAVVLRARCSQLSPLPRGCASTTTWLCKHYPPHLPAKVIPIVDDLLGRNPFLAAKQACCSHAPTCDSWHGHVLACEDLNCVHVRAERAICGALLNLAWAAMAKVLGRC
jgi:hypothetical protein